jgi:hypothetical protein
VGEVLSYWDFILTPMYMLIIYFIAYQIKAKQIIKYPEYKYFVKGLTFKIFGGIAFALVYVFYYDGGDTHTYFLDSVVVSKMLFHKPSIGLSILLGNLTIENYSHFDIHTYWPHLYIWSDSNTFAVVRYTTLTTILGARSYIVTTILVSCISYIGIWKVFSLFNKLYSSHTKYLALAILFMPSFIFWGSGIMKDTYIVGATCWISYNFYQIFIARKKMLLNLLFFIINFIIIINIKSYIIISLIPSMLIWLNQAYIQKIKSALFRTILLPFTILVVSISGFYIFGNVGDAMGDYGNVDSAIEKAKVTQQDLLREDSYGSNSYDLGEIDGSFSGMLKMAPLAIFTALYRPFLNEIGGVLMALSALENFILLLFTIYIILNTGPRKMLKIIKDNPLITYSIVFSIILAYGVGIATANFGAMVRYKIPLIPFYFSGLFLIYKINKAEKER